MNYEKKDIIRESKQLYGDINSCITDLVNSRIAHDLYNEGRAIFRMEGLMVGAMQHLGCVIDFLEEQKEQKPAEWSGEDEKNLELVVDCIYEFYPDPVMKYKLKDWLKSLRPQPHWKPSEEQMNESETGNGVRTL